MSVRGTARIFSGIQPTGIPHLGNYFGAISLWIRLANERLAQVPITPTPDQSSNQPAEINGSGQETIQCDTPIFSIVDVHAYSAQRANFGKQFYNNVLLTTASLLALGLDPNKCILFRQSDLFEHNYLDNVLDNFVSYQRLKGMIQFKEKSRGTDTKSISNALLNYPVLQAADILLYKANYVPVGDDQQQHIELTRDIARKFNYITGSELMVEPKALLNPSKHARRIRSLRDPEKKMSKSDPNQKSFIEVIDEPDVIVEKMKKALTDCESAVYYESKKRPSVSNLMRIHHLTTNESFDQIKVKYEGIETFKYKLDLAEILIEKFKSTREEFKRIKGDKLYLEQVLRDGHDKARPTAERMVAEVRHLLGSTSLCE